MTVTSLAGFPMLTGVESYKVNEKSEGEAQLLDRPDDRLTIACGSNVFSQTADGEVVYPGSEAFTGAGLQLTQFDAKQVASSEPAHDRLIQIGAFNSECYADTGTITATVAVLPNEAYVLSFLYDELWCAACESWLPPEALPCLVYPSTTFDFKGQALR